jgi:hypothetical protein
VRFIVGSSEKVQGHERVTLACSQLTQTVCRATRCLHDATGTGIARQSAIGDRRCARVATAAQRESAANACARNQLRAGAAFVVLRVGLTEGLTQGLTEGLTEGLTGLA